MSGMEREYIRDRALEGRESAASAARPAAATVSPDYDMLCMALHLRNQEMSLRDIASASSSPWARKGPASLASHVMRMPANTTNRWPSR